MGKTKRATRKELENVIGEMIQELNSLRFYVGMYIEWKGDKIAFNEGLRERFSEPQSKVKTSGAEGDAKSEKKNRYRKISQPL